VPHCKQSETAKHCNAFKAHCNLSSTVPATPVPREHHVHFSPVSTPGEAGETQALGQHYSYQDP
jgi:hypothetical protein